MNVLISGGTGLIGEALSESLIKDGHGVWVLTRSPEKPSAVAGVQLVGWDSRTPDGWSQVLTEIDAVVNLAGANVGDLSWTNERKKLILSSRVEAGQAITAAVEQSQETPRRLRVLVQASGSNYYGTRQDAVTERSQPGDDFLSKMCIDWEASTQGVEALGVRRVIIRSGVVLTPQGGALPRFLYPWRLNLGGPMGSGQQWLPWIHLADEVGAIRFLLEREDTFGAFNLVAPEPVRNAEFGRVLAEVMGKAYGFPIPAFALKALLGQMSIMVLEGAQLVPERLQKLGYTFQFPSLRGALMDLLR